MARGDREVKRTVLLNLPVSLRLNAELWARREKKSVEQFILLAVREKLERAGRSKGEKLVKKE